MKTKFFTNRKKAFMIAICIAIVLIAMICVPMMSASAYTGQSSGMTSEQVHSMTLATSVSTDTPAITVFMHGLGGNGGDWSNSMYNNSNNEFIGAHEFAEDQDSIIYKMCNNRSDIKLYRAYADSASSFMLYSGYSDKNTVETITEFSSHTVIVVEVYTWMEMEKAYERLHNVIDKISYDYFAVKGKLPRINLIGHSMGGLLNMQYAIEHPKNVAALVSIGTPYNGSWYDNWLVGQFIHDFMDQPCIAGTCGHSYYFCNLETRKNTWNSVYSQNKHIKFCALSGEITISLMEHIIYTNNYIEDNLDMSKAAADGIRTLISTIPVINLAGGYLPGDVCVDTDSQKAVGYNGVINYNKKFTTSNCNVNKRSQRNFPVPHNLEAYDSDMHNVILRVIDYGNNTKYNSYTQNGVTASIIAKSGDKWLIQLTNNTGSACSFDYNQRMCFESDAQNWSGLGHIACTDVIANGDSTIIEIQEYGTATSIAISYVSGSTRYIFYAKELNKSSCTMTSHSYTKSSYSYNTNNMKVSIVSKYGGKWIIKLTNNTGSARSFYYNANMCFESDAQNWTGLTDIAKTETLAYGASTILEIEEYGTATSIVISYTSGSTRYMFYAKNLSTSGTMTSYSSNRTYYVYSKNSIKASIIGKSSNKWLIELTNTTGSARAFDYNQRMCFESDAKNWSGLTHVISTINLANGTSTIIEIQEYGTATSIALSYTNGSTRYIFYAKNLSASGTMTSYSSTSTAHSYTQHGMMVGIIGKNGSTWQIKLTNNTGSTRSFWFNKRMCNFDDAKNWTTLSDIEQTQKLAAGESTIIEIQEYGTATSIALSYINGSTRYIFYANNLNAAGTMSSYSNTKAYNSYTKNGMTVSIAGNKNGTWLIELTNNTGSGRTFEYNYMMCYAGDAEKWTGLSHVKNVYLADGETTSKPLQISENGAATSIAISYMDGNIRKIFYAKNLNVAGTMTAYESTVDPSASSGGECVAAGTLITLADGSQKAVEELTGNELLLVWNLQTGSLDYAPILFIDSEQIGHYEVIKLSFSDGTAVDVISEHGFWDTDLNEYVYLDKYAADYIGHSFLKQDGSGMTEVVLTGVEISTEVTTAYSPVTYGHLCYYVNGMLSMPGGIEGLFNIFEVDCETMAYDAEAMAADIEQYGLFTYEEFNGLVPVTEEMFESVNGQYLKVAIGKGLISLEQISGLVERYSQFF